MLNSLLNTNNSLLEKEKNRHLEANAEVYITIKIYSYLKYRIESNLKTS